MDAHVTEVVRLVNASSISISMTMSTTTDLSAVMSKLFVALVLVSLAVAALGCGDSCHGVADGYYPSYCGCVSQYYQCHDNHLHYHYCHHHNHCWINGVCRMCGDTCEGKPDGYYPSVNRPRPAYYQCEMGQLYYLSCQPFQEFNPHTRKCQYDEMATQTTPEVVDPTSHSPLPGNVLLVIIIAGSATVFVLVLVVCCICCYCWRKRAREKLHSAQSHDSSDYVNVDTMPPVDAVPLRLMPRRTHDGHLTDDDSKIRILDKVTASKRGYMNYDPFDLIKKKKTHEFGQHLFLTCPQEAPPVHHLSAGALRYL
ncbi:hypothetical protein NP493_101g00018 [Ridgeia piscesae]|uniref:Chitin-binding type-2 domain-containing protein n=1 Tax=Ridgeia piscesae TaxID=27915 RepID=A0AAD9P7J6_RIDPI|nr:hypothetical protein NP493_101g00018 [Ridgeia piscesae]